MIKNLLDIRIRSFFANIAFIQKSSGEKKKSIGKLVLFAVLMLYVAVVFIALFVLNAIGLASAALPIGADNIYFGFFILIGFSMIFFFSIFETKSELFDCKDNALLLSMPIKSGDIVLSRIFTVLIYNYLELAAVAVPAIAVYAAFGGSARGIIGSAAVFLLLPLPATALASGVGYLVAHIEKKFKKNSFVTLALSLAFLAVYFIGYSALMNSSVMNPDSDIPDFSEAIKNMGQIAFIGDIAMLKPLNIILYLALSAGMSYLAYYIIKTNYISVITNSDRTKKTEYKGEKLTLSHPFFALTKKELERFISSAAYMLNSGLGVIFMLILGVASLFKAGEIREAFNVIVESEGMLLNINFQPVLAAVVIFMSSMCMISSSAMSLEGDSLWILKTLPEDPRIILASKLMPHLILTLPTSLVTSILFAVAFDVQLLDIIFLVITPIVANILFAVMGLYLNICFPKFKFANEAQVVKQSLATILSMALNMVWGIIMFVISFLAITGFTLLVSFLILLVHIALIAIFAYLLFTKGVEKFKKYSV